jgi:uncharacterized damage-inducible protein DinB
MNANAFRHLYGYHFAENRTLWDNYVAQLSDDQFRQPIAYSHGSVCQQIVHLISVDDTWFSGLRGVALPEPLDLANFPDRASIRAYWDTVEHTMRDYLAALSDETLLATPLDGEDQDLIVWQVLLHVVNHGTDHRAQILRIIHDFGIKTVSQDYIFYVYENPTRS